MKIAHLALLSAALRAANAFAPSSHLKNPATAPLAAVDASVIDPSVISADPSVLIGAAGATISAAAAAIFGFGKGGSKAEDVKVAPSAPIKVDVSVPYDAAARLAFNAYAESSTEKAIDFAAFRPLYEALMVAEVKVKVQAEKVNEKKPVVEEMRKELAALEGELSGLECDLAGFNDEAANYKSQIQNMFGIMLEAAPVAAGAATAAPSGVELWSVDYDAAAKLAYAKAGSQCDFEAFKTKYLADAAAMVAGKGLL